MRVKFVNLCLRVTKMARAEAPLSKLPWMVNCPTNRRGDLHLKVRNKTVIVLSSRVSSNSRGSYPLADMETSDNTRDQVHSQIDLP